LNLLVSQFPTYDVINLEITGYDYPALESYQRFVDRIAKAMDIEISIGWAHPPAKKKIVRFKENSTNISSEYNLTTYKRYLQLTEVQAPSYNVFLRFIQSGLPEGVNLSVVHHTDLIEESRYVPDKELLELKDQLDKAGGPILKTRK
jgi:large subunit ribosomal protein L48